MILWSADIFQLGISVPSLLPSVAATVLFREQPPPALVSLHQISYKWLHLAPWEAATAHAAPVHPLSETGGGTEWEQQQAASWTTLRTPKTNKQTSLSFFFLTALLLFCSWTCTFYSVTFQKILNSNFLF